VKRAKWGPIINGDRLITFREMAAIAQLSDHGFDLIEAQCSLGG